ncbi:MAG: hypothetical protein ACRBM6_31670 [Geminicoccales bacterium]
MAISNAYKPSWRSRRRSRLSLVERSVPRLGRVPGSENVSQADTPSTQQQPHDTENDKLLEAEQALTSPATPAHDLPADEQSMSDEHGPLLPAPHVEDADKPSDDSEEGLAVPLDSETTASESAEQDHTEAEETVITPETADQKPPMPRIVVDETADDTEGTPTAGGALALPKALQASWDIDSMSAAVRAKAKTDTAAIQLEWDALIPLGLVDPRDRARPLPARMDDIARALIRQALSDQSSWRDRIILVSSARENRAKSMAALNFAFALTTIDRHKVVLLDANMDGHGVGTNLGVSGHAGLTNALCDSNVEIEDIELRTSLDRLTLVASGGFEDDILDRFASRRMLEILRTLTKDPETLLVLEAPPILSSQEATVLSVIAGQVVLVVEAGTTDERSINLALKRIGDRHNINLVLSQNSGIASDSLNISETRSGHRSSPPSPTASRARRRLRKTAACLAMGIAFGVSLLLGSGLLSADHGARDLSHLPERPSLAPEIKPIASTIGSTVR